MLPYLSSLHLYRIKEWDNYHLWNEDFSFSISILDYGCIYSFFPSISFSPSFRLKYNSLRVDIAKVAVNFVDFKTQKYSSNGFTIPTAELRMPTNINNIYMNSLSLLSFVLFCHSSFLTIRMTIVRSGHASSTVQFQIRSECCCFCC
jgi:hypothetical protein